MDTEYRKHQTMCLLNEADTRIPVYQEAVEREKRVCEKQKEIDDIQKHIYDFTCTLRRTKRKEEKDKILQNIDILRKFLRKKEAKLHRIRDEKKEREVFIMACPRTDCRGRVSSVYRCGLCESWFCPECHAEKTLCSQEHECLEEDRQTVQLLKKNTKSCPKCLMGIFKVNGCDQMWCVSCHTCFSWKTGAILTGTVHNPHYFEFLRRTRQGYVPRTVGDVVCGGLPSFHHVYAIVNRWWLWLLGPRTKIMDMYRMVVHLSEQTLPRHRLEITNWNDVALGMSYLKNEITRQEWGHILFLRHRKREREQQYIELFEMVIDSASSLFRDFVARKRNEKDTFAELQALVIYTNEQIDTLNKQYGVKKRHITPYGTFMF